jgi:hypothetical protein
MQSFLVILQTIAAMLVAFGECAFLPWSTCEHGAISKSENGTLQKFWPYLTATACWSLKPDCFPFSFSPYHFAIEVLVCKVSLWPLCGQLRGPMNFSRSVGEFFFESSKFLV